MDYEEKYKTALERARIWKDKSGMPKDKQGILDDIFPELAESEDERIRKAILEHIQLCTESIPDRDKFIAYLEKQGEQNLAWSEEDGYNVQCLVAKVVSDIQKGNVGRNQELIDWLQSLKQRTTWKPTEEQMKALNEAVGIVGLFTPRGSYLKSLSEQLKRLIYKHKEG